MSGSHVAILYPVFAQVALTFAIFFLMGYERFKAVQAGTVKRSANAGEKPIWPERAAVVSNAFHNQLEIPMLFYGVVAFSIFAGAVDGLTIVLAWLFVGLRLLHALIHTTYNSVSHRFLAYGISTAMVVILWVRLFLHVSTSGAA